MRRRAPACAKISSALVLTAAEPSAGRPDDRHAAVEIADNLIWVDALEMTGLFPDTGRIIEVAVVIYDPQLTIRVEAPSSRSWKRRTLDLMDAWNKNTRPQRPDRPREGVDRHRRAGRGR